MAALTFTDVLQKAGLDPSRVKLIRHPLARLKSKAQNGELKEKDIVLAYTQQQKNGFSNGFDYWCVFVGDKSTLAKFYACYKVKGSISSATPDMLPPDCLCPEWYNGTDAFFDLEYMDCLKEYENRLVIDWGPSARSWAQKGTSEKPIVSIYTDEKKYFAGFETLVLTYDELKKIVDTSQMDETWYTALSSVYAIYLIVDVVSGQQYVGSAYGNDGLWGRWETYIRTLHGGNKKIIELLNADPERYHQFQFSVLQILPKTARPQDVIDIESLYKKKLRTIEFGLNDN